MGFSTDLAAPRDHDATVKATYVLVRARRELGLYDSVSNDPIEERLREVIVGEIESPTVVVTDYEPAWQERFRREEARIGAAPGEAALSIEHTGSTSVSGLSAKPIADILLVVEDSAEEATYVPAPMEAGYVLRVREPGYDEHRMFRAPVKDVHEHVFSPGSQRIARHLLLRDHLREYQEDRELYARTKRELAKGTGRACGTTPRPKPGRSKAPSPELPPADTHKKPSA